MINYTDALLAMSKYDNYLIPDIPKILAKYLIKHEEHFLIFIERKFKVEDMLIILAQNFTKDEVDIEYLILKQILVFFGIEENND